MEMKKPIGVTLIGYFYIWGVLVLLLTLGIEQNPQFNIRFGVPIIPEILVRLFVIIFSLIMSMFYLKLSKLGYYLIMFYSLFFFIFNLKQISIYNSQPFIGNCIFSLIVVIYSFRKRRYFIY